MRPIYFVLPIAAAFSGGGGSGETDSGAPIQQSCDAIGVCALPDEDGSLKCPDGMHKVAPPVRSEVYVLATEAGGTTYVPGELVPLTLTVTQRQILGMVDKGRGNTTLESAKYIGLLLYAVREGDAKERKIGSWEIPLQVPPRFWTPPDPSCGGKAVMHRSSSPKSFVERFLFRAPAETNAGSLIFRALVKQGDTNAGAFYWLGAGDERPSAGKAGGDLTLTEAPPPPPDAVTWRRAGDGQTCAQACADASLVCDETALGAVQSAPAFQEAVDGQHVCRLPLLASCDGPSASRMVDGFCWYPSPECAAPTCDAPPAGAGSLGARLCPCAPAGRRALSEPIEEFEEVEEEAVMTAAGCPNARLAAMRGEEAAPCPSGRRALGLDDSPAQPTTPVQVIW